MLNDSDMPESVETDSATAEASSLHLEQPEPMADNDTVFLELCKGQYDRVFFLFRRKGLGKEEALDLTQDTFTRVYKGMKTYRGDSVSGYVLQVAENVWKNHLRYWAAATRAAEEVPVDDSVLSVPDGSNTISELVRHEQEELLKSAISDLPERMQKCFHFWFEGLKYREIAAVMDISLDTVKSLIYQGKKRLQEALGETDLPIGRRSGKGDADD